MSVSKLSKGLLLGLALLLATSVFAANKRTLQVSDPVTVNGKQLAAGDYVALCFVPKGTTTMDDMEDMEHFGADMDTEPHYSLGMIREFTVS